MKKKFLKISNDLIKNSLNNGPLAYIFKTKIHAILVFNIFGSEKITFENLCRNLVNVASRTTIQSILAEGVNKNYLLKEIDKDDKRKKYYNCINLKDTLNEWYKNNKILITKNIFKSKNRVNIQNATVKRSLDIINSLI